MSKEIKAKIRKTAKKLKLVRMKGGKCNFCEYNNEQLLQFHHIDPTTKLFNIGRCDCRMSKMIEEADKCILVCANCHVLLHCKTTVKNDQHQKMKTAFLEYLGARSCCKCGESKSQAILEFHHLCSEKKDFTINSYRGGYKNLSDKIKTELDKCVVMCRNCHFEEHFDKDFYDSVTNQIESKEIIELSKVDENIILELFENGKSVTEISKLFGINKSTVSTMLTRLGKRQFLRKEITIDRTLLKHHIDNGLKNKEIASLMKCSATTISNFRKKYKANNNSV